MRIESSATSLSWIPLGAAEGFNRLSFGLRVAHYDPPPPEVLGDLDELEAHDRFRFANQLKAWIRVENGRVVDAGQGGGGRINVTRVGYGSASIAFTPVALPDLRPAPELGPSWARFVQTTGGRTGFPTPRRVRYEPYFQIGSPVAWSTLAPTIHADGTAEQAAEEGPRRVADIVNISSIAGRVASNGFGVYSFTKFGVRGFTESLHQEVTQRHVRVGVVEPGGVATELGSHNKPEVRNQMIDPFYEQTEVLAPEDIADGVAYMVTRPRHTAIGELWIMPTDQL